MPSDMDPADLIQPIASGIEDGARLGANKTDGVYDIPVTVAVVLGKTTMEAQIQDTCLCRDRHKHVS